MRFGPLDIAYDERVLAPRPWTAARSQWAVTEVREHDRGVLLRLVQSAHA